MKLRIVMVAVACLFSLSVFALPDYPHWTTYYDEEGCEVGYRNLDCGGHWYTSGTVTDNFCTEYGDPCHTEVEWYTCQDLNLVALSEYGFPRCVSEGFALWCEFNPQEPLCHW